MNQKWQKPKKWGGYDTTNLIFFVLSIDFSKIITEKDSQWDSIHNNYLTNGFYFYGAKTHDEIQKIIKNKSFQ